MKADQVPFKSYRKIADALLTTAKAQSDLSFVRKRGTHGFIGCTYQETLSNVKKIGNYLKEQGLASGERAALIGENCPEWMFSHLGILWAGGVVVPLDARATPVEWAHLMRHSESKFLFVSSAIYEDMTELKETIPTLGEIISFSGNGSNPSLPLIFETLGGMAEPEKRSREDTAVIIYTSGTTGSPKGVLLTHGNLLANIEQCLRALDLDEKDRFFSVLPIHHVFEGTVGFLLPMAIGSSVTIATSLKSKELLEDLKETRPTIFLAVPLLLEKLYQGIERNLRKASSVKKALFYGLKTLVKAVNPVVNGGASETLFRGMRASMGLDKLRFLISGGAALPRSLSKEYEMLGFPIFQGYGITESAPVISVNLPNRCKNESAGRPLEGIEVKIVDGSSDGTGEIVIRGPNVMKGYYKNENATQEVLQDRWFYTGDLGKMDSDGFLYVTGRKKSVIVTKGGKNIHPEEIEEELLKSPFIKETLVLAKIHPRTKHEEVHAIIYPDFERLDEHAIEKGLTIDEKVIRHLIEQHIEKVNKKLAEYKKIRNFSVREEEFPKTNTQKIKRYLFEEGGIEVRSKK